MGHAKQPKFPLVSLNCKHNACITPSTQDLRIGSWTYWSCIASELRHYLGVACLLGFIWEGCKFATCLAVYVTVSRLRQQSRSRPFWTTPSCARCKPLIVPLVHMICTEAVGKKRAESARNANEYTKVHCILSTNHFITRLCSVMQIFKSPLLLSILSPAQFGRSSSLNVLAVETVTLAARPAFALLVDICFSFARAHTKVYNHSSTANVFIRYLLQTLSVSNIFTFVKEQVEKLSPSDTQIPHRAFKLSKFLSQQEGHVWRKSTSL